MKKMLMLSILLPVALSGCALPIIAAGVGAGVLAAHDPRSAGTQFDDKVIGVRATDALNAALGNQGHVVATCYDRVVLLTGQVPTDQMKQQAEQIVRQVPDVREVRNALTVGFTTSLMQRSQDTLITTEVKARLLQDRTENGDNIKVVTENGVVYLMGMVSQATGNAAAQDASTTRGVHEVVKLFDYVG